MTELVEAQLGRAVSPRSGGSAGSRGPAGSTTPRQGTSGDRDVTDTRRRVLLIEDDPRLLRALSRVLQFDGFEVLIASDARSAQQLAQEHGAEIRVIVTDILLPDASATELAAELAKSCGQVPILFMSGSPTQGAE